MEKNINFDGTNKPSRLSHISCEGYDNSSRQSAVIVNCKTYVTPKTEPRFLLDMEAKGSIPLWGVTRTNSLLVMAESEAKRNEIKMLITDWRLGGKMLIPARYNTSPIIMMIFNSYPIYLAGLKIFNEYLSLADPMYSFKDTRIFNLKTCLTERPEMCRKTGRSVFERQIIIARQLDCGPAMLYISNFMKNENLKEGLRYQVKYSDREYDNSECEQSAQPTPFDYNHKSLDIRSNWVAQDNQEPEETENELQRWLNTVISQDQLYVRRLENSEKLEILAIKNRKNEKKMPANVKRVFDLETYTFDQESSEFCDPFTNESIRRSELGSCSTISSARKIRGVNSKSRTKKSKKSFSSLNASAKQAGPNSSFAIKKNSSVTNRFPRSPVMAFNNSFFESSGAENLINWNGRGSLNRTIDQSRDEGQSGISQLEHNSTWDHGDGMSHDSIKGTNSTLLTEAARK